MNRRSKTPGVSRIDQPSHRTHGFFARVCYQGGIYSAFFADKKYGGKRIALAAAQQFQTELRRRLGMPGARSRRWNAEVVRRRGRSGIHGVRRVVMTNSLGYRLKYWTAQWSPARRVYRKKQFSIRKYGEERAKELAIRARREGVRNMK